MKKFAVTPGLAVLALTLAACGGGPQAAELADPTDATPGTMQPQPPEIAPGTILASHPDLGFPTTDVDFREAVVALEDEDDDDVYNLLTADGAYTPLRSSQFVDIDDVLDASEDFVLVVGETLTGNAGVHAYSYVDDTVLWSVAADVHEGDVELTEDFFVYLEGCVPHAHALEDGRLVDVAWPAPPEGSSCQIRTGFQNLVSLSDYEDYHRAVDLEAGTEVDPQRTRPNFDASYGNSGYGVIRGDHLVYDDGQIAWTASETMPSDAEVSDVRHDRVMVRMDSDGFLWTVYDIEAGERLGLVNLQGSIAADDCESGGLMRSDRLLLGCEIDDMWTLYIVAV